MKVALIHHEDNGGIGNYVKRLAKSISNKVETIIIFGTTAKERVEYDFNIKIYYLKCPQVMPRFVWFQLKNRNNIKRILEKEKVDIIHTQSSSSAYLLTDNVFRNKKIVTFHGTIQDSVEFKKIPLRYITLYEYLIHGISTPLWHHLNKIEYKLADEIITFNNYTKELVQKYYGYNKKIYVIPQGISPFKVRRKSDDSIVFVGRLIWTKGITYLLKAFRLVNKEMPEIRLKIIGNGPLLKYIIKFSRRFGLEERIIVMGNINNERVIKEISEANMVVIPSLYEAESISMLEVMACAKPLVLFDLPFTKQRFKHKTNSYLVKPKSIVDLAEAIKTLYVNKRLATKIGKGALSYIKENHDQSKLSKEYLKIYRDVIKEK